MEYIPIDNGGKIFFLHCIIIIIIIIIIIFIIYFQDWGSVDPEKFTINANGGHKFTLADNIEIGNYNMLLTDCILWKPETNLESHDLFRGALPGGFAWELLELQSGSVFYM